METKRMRDAAFQVRGTLPLLTKWSCFGFTTREEATQLIKRMSEEGWCVESRGVNNSLSDDWLREAEAQDDIGLSEAWLREAEKAETSEDE